MDTYDKILYIVTALDRRFPNGKDIFQRVSRLCEESGELASAVNHREDTGIKRQKHGEPTDEAILKEMQDVMRTVVGIAQHYQLEDKLRQNITDFYDKYQKEEKLGY